MMKERSYYKRRGKFAFQQNYWKCVLVAFIMALVIGGVGGNSTFEKRINTQNQNSIHYNDDIVSSPDHKIASTSDDCIASIPHEANGVIPLSNHHFSGQFFYDDNGASDELMGSLKDMIISDLFPPAIASILFNGLFLSLATIASLVAIALRFFVFNTIHVGCNRFFIDNADYATNKKQSHNSTSMEYDDIYNTEYSTAHPVIEKPNIGKVLSSFQNGYYMNTVKTMFFKGLYTFLWSLLLFIPGIIKHYEYCMIPYLIADYPEMETAEAFQLSREMMYGNKMGAFLLDLSFIGWAILNTLTFGILGVFYVNPYVQATAAELYLDLKAQNM